MLPNRLIVLTQSIYENIDGIDIDAVLNDETEIGIYGLDFFDRFDKLLGEFDDRLANVILHI